MRRVILIAAALTIAGCTRTEYVYVPSYPSTYSPPPAPDYTPTLDQLPPPMPRSMTVMGPCCDGPIGGTTIYMNY